ncbi:hypothetical protein U9M48_002661, partial [Paspalum notatum var. saurae]
MDRSNDPGWFVGCEKGPIRSVFMGRFDEPMISKSLKRCGISDDTTYILAAPFDASDEEMKAVEKLVRGAAIDLAELESRANQQILKHYKIPPQELSISTLPDTI